MIKTDEVGKYVMSFETNAVIRRIPLPKYGTSSHGREWVLGGMVVECYDDNESESAQLYMCTFDPELVETIEKLGVGKKVKLQYHLSCKEYYDSYRISLILDSISGMSENEDYVYGTKKGDVQ